VSGASDWALVSPGRHRGPHRMNGMNYEDAEVAERAEDGGRQGEGNDTDNIKVEE